MATLNQYQVNNTNGRLYFPVISNPVVEPLDGPLFVEHLMSRFPEEVYAKGRDTHLYNFLTALVGDAGAGGLKKKSLLARLQYEGSGFAFQNLDNLYSPLIGFDRLPGERYRIDPKSNTLTSEEWEVIRSADQSYRRRAIGYLQAARLGGTLQGIEEAAAAALGQSVQVSENYKYVFDQITDRKIGYSKYGNSNSVAEFIIRPNVNQNTTLQEEYAILNVGSPDLVETFRFVLDGERSAPIYIYDMTAAGITAVLNGLAAIEQGDASVVQTTSTSYTIKFLPSALSVQDLEIEYNANVGLSDISIAFSAATSLFYAGEAGDPNSEYYEAILKGSSPPLPEERMHNRYYLDPFVQKNLDALVAKIKPVATTFTIRPARERYIPVAVNAVSASSEKFTVSRFVTGNSAVGYTTSTNLLNGKILEQGVENEARTYAYTGIDLPVVSMTINAAIAYRDEARNDIAYGKSEFYRTNYAASAYGSPYLRYRSIHAGVFPEVITKIFPFLASVSPKDIFAEENILPRNDTLAIIKKPVTL